MGVIRPGEFTLTKEAMDICQFPKGAELLDVGCGEGDTLAWLAENYDVKGTGIDRSKAMIAKGKEKHPTLDLQEGDAELLEFTSFSFDGVLMECTLSLINFQMEAMHEAYCVLKKGGKLIITDLYVKDPDPQKVQESRADAKAAWNKPHEEGDCGHDEHMPSEYCLDGAFVKESLIELGEEAGFVVHSWEDKSDTLTSFVAEKIFEFGSLDAYWKSITPEGEEQSSFCKATDAEKLGYFLMILEKPKD